MFDDFNGLRVTQPPRITLAFDPEYGNCKAFVSVLINNAIVISNIRVIVSAEGRLYASMPARKKPNGTYSDVAFPVNNAARLWLETIVLGEYHAELARYASDAEWRDRLACGLIEPPASSCGHPTEQAYDEANVELRAAS